MRSLAEVLDDDTVDVVHVTSPNDLHVPQAREILAAGKHVVCEKPLAMSAAESADLVALAAASGRINATNFNIRYYPLNQHAHELVSDGGLGEVRLVTGRYFQDWLLLDSDWNWRLQPDRGGALRAVGDIGSHWLDLMTFVTGQHVQAVMAELTTFIDTRLEPTGPVETFSTERSAEAVAREIGTEDTATILLRFDGGARGAVSISQISPGRKNSLAVRDRRLRGRLVVGFRAARPGLARPPRPTQRDPHPQPGPHGRGGTGRIGPARRPRRGLLRHVLRTFPGRLRGRGRRVASSHPGYPTFADGHDEMLVGDAIARSAREGRWVEVDRSAAQPRPVASETSR